GAPAPPEPRSALAGPDVPQARRGPRRYPRLGSPGDRARARDGADAAVPVRGAHSGRVLGHGRAGCRLLRAVHAVLRPRACRVPPPPRPSAASRPVRDARVDRRVPRARALRRPARGLRPCRARRHDERHLRPRRLPRRGRRPDGDRKADARPDQPGRPASHARARLVPRPGLRVREINAAAIEAIESIVAGGGEVDDVLRHVVAALVDEGDCGWAGILFAEEDELVLGPQAGNPDPGLRLQIPVVYEGSRVAELVVDGCDDPTALDRVAKLIATHCLVGWDTAGEPWQP